MNKASLLFVLMLVAASGGGCGASGTLSEAASSGSAGTTASGVTATSNSSGRDWVTFPAIVDLPMPSDIYAISDIHGGYLRMLHLLDATGLISASPDQPSDIEWTGGSATLVVIGDIIDKGPDAVDAIQALISFAASAAASGGQVVVTLGNHEAEFLANPDNRFATCQDGFTTELQSLKESAAGVANGADPTGTWLRQLPLAASIGQWFFVHSGDTGGLDEADLSAAFQSAVDANDYNDSFLIGLTGPLESRHWFEADPTLGSQYAATLSVQHIVFGHEPSEIPPNFMIGVAQNGTLFRIDCGMSPDIDFSHGMVLHIFQSDNGDQAEGIDPQGCVTPLWPLADVSSCAD